MDFEGFLILIFWSVLQYMVYEIQCISMLYVGNNPPLTAGDPAKSQILIMKGGFIPTLRIMYIPIYVPAGGGSQIMALTRKHYESKTL